MSTSDTVADCTALDRLFRPRAIAVIGASTNAAKIGGMPIAHLLRMGYAGSIYPVNPNASEIQGLKCYASVRDINAPIDVAILAVPMAAAEQALADAGDAGATAAVLFASGCGSRVVTPNHDTPYTNAWLDPGDEPLVIDVPDTAGRYYALGLLDFYTNPFAHIGQRLTGTGAGLFLITPPGWRGAIPREFAAPGRHVPSPTRWVWIIGRILVDGEHELPAVHALQDRFVLRPLSAWRANAAGDAKRFHAVIDAETPLAAEHYRAVVSAALRENPPPAAERDSVARFAAIGIGANAGLGASAEQLRRLDAAIELALSRLREAADEEAGAASWARPDPHRRVVRYALRATRAGGAQGRPAARAAVFGPTAGASSPPLLDQDVLLKLPAPALRAWK